MGNIIKKMRYQVPGSFLGLDILLSANMTEPALCLSITVQAGLISSFFKMTQGS